MLPSTGMSTPAVSPLRATRPAAMIRSARSRLCEPTGRAWTTTAIAATTSTIRAPARISQPFQAADGSVLLLTVLGSSGAAGRGSGRKEGFESGTRDDLTERIPGYVAAPSYPGFVELD